MLCKIADLIVEVPAVGDLVPRSVEYQCEAEDSADIIIRTNLFRPENWQNVSENTMIYMESGFQFYAGLLRFNGLMLHSSAIEKDGMAYLFSGPSGVGKSTHTGIWQKIYGESAKIFNDDKPALRRIDGKWYAYGTPWCGKDGINRNRKVPLAGICFLNQAEENKIRRLTASEATGKVVAQTPHRFKYVHKLDLMLDTLDHLVREIPVFELKNRPEPEAAFLSYETMRRAAEELGL